MGLALALTALISWMFVLPVHVRGHVGNPYIGILVFIMIPAVFFAGLGLIPLGVFLGRRRIKKGLAQAITDPKLALRRLAWFLGSATVLNLILGTQFTYRAVEHMESVQFCGQTCHTVMKPEFVAFQNSPHSLAVRGSAMWRRASGAGWPASGRLAPTDGCDPEQLPRPIARLL
jgi:hypothetical protein